MNTVSITFYLMPRSKIEISYTNIHFLSRFDQVQIQPRCLSYNSLSNYGFSGFAAEAPVNALQTLSTQDTQYKPDIEEDKVVSAYGDYAAAV